MKKLWVITLLIVLAVFATAYAQDDVVLIPVENTQYGIQALAPEGWSDIGPGLYARGNSAQDTTLIALQSAPLNAQSLLQALLPQLGLTEAPAAIGSYTGGTLAWTLYQVDVPIPSGVIRVDLALASQGGVTYLALLQTNETEYDGLHEQVFIPILDAFAPLAQADATDAAEPAPYVSEDVTFPGGADGVTLAGTLTLPEGEGQHPAVVLMSGSGGHDRNGSLQPVAAIQPFALIADALTRAGVAVLRYDDRGIGESTGDFTSATIPDFTADGAAAVAFLLSREDIDPDQIGILGHSEGGIYAATLAAENSNVAFVIGMAPPAATGVELMVEQNVAVAESQGATAEVVEMAREFAQTVYADIIAGDWDAVEQSIRDYFGRLYDLQTPDIQAAIGSRDAFIQSQLDSQIPIFQSPWYRSLLTSDSGANWAQVTVPVLGLFGGKDIQVLAETNAAALEAALDSAGNTDYQITVFPNANHLFQEAVTGALEEYGSLEQTFTPDFLPTLLEWVLAHVTVVE